MKAHFFPCTYEHVFCDTYACSSRAKWFIGRADGPISLTWKLCQDCAENLVATLPEEILPRIKEEPQMEELPFTDEETTKVEVEQPKKVGRPKKESDN